MIKLSHFSRVILFAAAVTLAVTQSGCQKDDFQSFEESHNGEKKTTKHFDNKVPVDWYNLQLRLIRTTPGFTPPVAARALGYSGVALYESIHKGIPSGNSLVGQLQELNAVPQPENNLEYNWPLVANAAMAQTIRQLYANTPAANVSSIDSLELADKNFYINIDDIPADVVTRSINHGVAVANAIYAWSMNDGGHQAYANLFPASYVPPTGDGMWVPTPPALSAAMLPYWGTNRTFVPANNAASFPMPAAPPAYSTATNSTIYQAANQVYTMVNNLTQAQKDIASYWNDGGGSFTPPGHNLAIVAQIIQEKGYTLDKAAKLFAQAAIAQYDASIVCWNCKFHYNLQRPVTYIRNNINATWSSFIPTPPFPAYTSGHSTFTSAAAKILSANVGSNYAFTDYTKVPYGFSPRSFPSFNAAANEAAISRLYGGIHYSFDNNEGLTCGNQLAQNVLNLSW
jgi:hypothetical protein